MGIERLGNLAFINRAVGIVNPAMIQGGRITRLILRFAIGGVAEAEIFACASFVLEKLL